MKTPRWLLVLALLATALLAVPAAASAAQIVNTTADEADEVAGGECKTAANKCSLRAAIEVTNLAGVADTILFDGSVFKGRLADTIALTSELPHIEAPVTIDAGTCLTAAGINGPCAGINPATFATGFVVQEDDVSILDLSISDAFGAILVNASNFTAAGDWLGIKLDGQPAAGEEANAGSYGIRVEPNTEKGQIGGTAAVQRNVVAGFRTGLLLRGSKENTVAGNYFGAAPDGTTAVKNLRDLVIADSGGGVQATGNTVGAVVGAQGAGTSACDLGCNVFLSDAASVAAIDLKGQVAFEEKPATGPTTIVGNYIGRDASGAVAASAADAGIEVGNAGDVTVGSKEAGGGNLINGGNYAVVSGAGPSPAKRLRILGNSIGRKLDNSGAQFPPDIGLGIFSEGITLAADAAVVEANWVSAEGTGVESHSTGATIAGNYIFGGNRGIHVWGDTEGPGIGNTIRNNAIGEAQTGVYIQNDLNVLTGNFLTGNETGIAIEDFSGLAATGNRIGGDGSGEANTINTSQGNAIEIVDVEGSQNEVARNAGSGNGGKFIRLKATEPLTEPAGPNGGIKPPTVASATKAEASGTAAPEAVVRVFAKSSSAAGELGAYLGKTTADGSGAWKLTYLSPVAGGTLVAATQTNTEGGTSEVGATASVPPDPPSGCPAVPSACPPPGPQPTPDTQKPRVTIKKAPKAKSKSTTAKFVFSSNESGSSFQCRLDKKKFAKCRSPKTYRKLKPGRHVFKVRATDAAGNLGAAVTRRFTVLE